MNILLKGIKRFLPAMCSFIIILSPAFLIGLLLNFIAPYALSSHKLTNEYNPNLETILATFFMLAISIAMIVWMMMVLYFYFAMYFIVIKEASPVKGLKDSLTLTQGHWFKTFCLVLFLVLITVLLQNLFVLIVGKLAKDLVSLIMTPLSASLMIIYYHYLARLRQGFGG